MFSHTKKLSREQTNFHGTCSKPVSLEFEDKGFPFCKNQVDYNLYHNEGTGIEEID